MTLRISTSERQRDQIFQVARVNPTLPCKENGIQKSWNSFTVHGKRSSVELAVEKEMENLFNLRDIFS